MMQISLLESILPFAIFFCNASKGAKLLHDWVNTDYCVAKSITRDSVSHVIKQAIEYT